MGMEFTLGALVTVFLVLWGAMAFLRAPSRKKKKKDDLEWPLSRDFNVLKAWTAVSHQLGPIRLYAEANPLSVGFFYYGELVVFRIGNKTLVRHCTYIWPVLRSCFIGLSNRTGSNFVRRNASFATNGGPAQWVNFQKRSWKLQPFVWELNADLQSLKRCKVIKKVGLVRTSRFRIWVWAHRGDHPQIPGKRCLNSRMVMLNYAPTTSDDTAVCSGFFSRKTLAQRAKSGDLEVKRQATWGMSEHTQLGNDWSFEYERS